MNWMKVIKYIALVFFVLIAGLLLWYAYSSGQQAGQSRQIVKDATSIRQALEYFYQDQNRYPSTDEYKDANLMRQYLSGFPPQEFVSKTCPSTYQYVNNFRNDYELRICLPKGVLGYKTGWNKIIAPVKP